MSNENSFKTLARFAPTSWMTGFRNSMKKAGYQVVNDSAAGTCVVYDKGEVVARGLKMGRMGWMVRANPDVVQASPGAENGPKTEGVMV